MKWSEARNQNRDQIWRTCMVECLIAACKLPPPSDYRGIIKKPQLLYPLKILAVNFACHLERPAIG